MLPPQYRDLALSGLASLSPWGKLRYDGVMADPDLSKWDLWTIIAVLSEQRHHKYWNTRVSDVRARLEAGADPDAGRFAPLSLASSMGHLPICALLLEFGADVNGGCRYRTPLVAASDHPQIKRLLLDKGAVETIFSAIAAGDTAEVQTFLERDISLVHVHDEGGMTPLFLASGRRDLESMTMVLDAGADPKIVAAESHGISPIHHTCRRGGPGGAREAIALLVRHGADLDARDRGGVTALHMAVRDRDIDAVRALLGHGAAVDIEDRGRKSTPLRRAVANTGRPGTSGRQDVAVEITAILLDHGADPKHVNRSGKPMLASTRHAEIRALLEAAIRAG